MVLRRGDTRHKDVPDPLEAGPKRVPTIHAQRKFAQGSGLISPGMSPIKEKEKSGKLNGGGAGAGMGLEHHSQSPSTSSSNSSSAIPAKRPRTEDFITFLCYRGTSVLPSELNSFNVATKPEKFDRDSAAYASGSMKQCSSPRQDEKKMKRMKCTKRAVMQSKSKVLDQRQRKTRINAIVQKAGKILKNQKVNSKALGKRVAAVTVTSKSKQIKARPAVPIRASHASILKRLGASRVRAGLRSSGQLPPGSDVGLKIERKPLAQKYLKNKILSPKHKVDTPVRMKAKVDGKIPLGTPLSRRNAKARDLKSTPSKSTPPRSLNLLKRPSRKTKEAAALYMELITKDLRSPDEDDEPPKGDDVSGDSPSIKTRARSGTTELTDVPPSPGKASKKKNPPQTTKKSSKSNSSLPAPKNSMKRTRSSVKEEAYDSPLEEEIKTPKKSVNSDKVDRVRTKSNGGRIGKKVENPNSNVPRKNAEEASDVSSQSEDDEGSISQPSPKRAKKGTKNVEKQPSNSGSSKEQDLSRRSTRSSRGAEDVKVDHKTTDKKSRLTKSKATTSQVASESDLSSSDEEATKQIKKEVASRTRQTIKKEPKSESDEDEDITEKKPSRLSKTKENHETIDEEESTKPTKLAVGKKSTDKESSEQVAKKRPGRPKKSGPKTSVTKDPPKKTEVEEKVKRRDSKINKSEIKSETSSDSETEPKTTRQTRKSKPGNSDSEKKSVKRTSRANPKAESENDDNSNKTKKASKSESSKEELPKGKRLSRQAALKSEESDDEELSDKGKQISKAAKPKRPSRLVAGKAEAKKKVESEESDEPDHNEDTSKSTKSLRKSSIKSSKSDALSDQSAESDKETLKSRKSARQSTATKVELDEVKKAKVTRQSTNLESDYESEEAQKQTKKPSKLTRIKSLRNVDDNSANESEGSSRALSNRSKPKSDEADVSKKPTLNHDSSGTKTSSKKAVDAPKETSQQSKNSVKIEGDSEQNVTASKAIPAKRGRPSKASLINGQRAKDQSKLTSDNSDEIVSKGDKTKGSMKETKDKPEPKKRGRKPKKVEENPEIVEEESQIRTSKRRAATKKETYSEFTEGEDEEDSEEETEQSVVTLSRTRGRKSNVKYTEKDTDDEEFEDEKRPLRARRSAFRSTLDVDLYSEDEFLELVSKQKSQDTELVSKKKKSKEESQSEDSDISDKPQETSSKKTKPGKILAGTDASSQSSRTTRRNSFGSKMDFPVVDEKADSTTKVTTYSNVQSTSEVPSIDTKRVTRRLSKDKIDLACEDDAKPEPKIQELMSAIPIAKSEVFREEVKTTFMDSLTKIEPQYDDNDGLATLADVAFSELQNRKNIMGRKLSSDSATSFSSDDVLLPVRKEKVLPKAKADLPTVREKTESDEDLSDVGNEETNDDSSYDEYRKMGKSTRRKRMPKRVRKEPVRLPSQRPVRNRRAKLNNDFNEDSFSSDRSSSPEPTKPKSIQKRRRKSEEKLAADSKPSVPKRSDAALPIPSIPNSVTPANVSTVSTFTSAAAVKEAPAVKPIKETKTAPVKVPPKQADPQWNLLLKVADSKASHQEPITSAPKSITVQSSMKPRQPFEASTNNSVTLFSGVSGVCIMKADGKLLGGLPMSKEEFTPQTKQSLSSSRVLTDSPTKPPVHSRPVTSTSSQPPSKGMFNSKKMQDNSIPISTVKPNIGDTWKNAFINAKFPKPGQLSPAHHSNVGTPFVRKPFSPSPKTPTKPEEAKLPAFVPTKLPGVQTFKNMSFQNFGKMGDQSPNRLSGGMSPNRTPVNNPPSETKQHVYLSPSRVKNSPSKFEEKVEIKKPESSNTKSLTLLQYEKRSQELISSLKESQPVLVDGNQFVPAYPTKLKEYSMEKSKTIQSKPVQQPLPNPTEESTKPEGGKHLNLPFPVEQAFRKRSPITVKKPTKPVGKKSGLTVPEASIPSNVESSPQQNNNPLVRPTTEIPSSSTDFSRIKTNSDVLSKKKFQLTKEEINKWLIDSTNSGIEHTKGCGIFDNVQCKCTDQSRGDNAEKVPVVEVVLKQEELSRIDHGVVEPPVQLKELDSNNKFTAETISTCKVEDYKEKMLSKNPKSQPVTNEGKRDLVPPSLPKSKKLATVPVEKVKRKSMTEEEMCDFDFRFERTSTSPRESGSDMSSPTPRDDVSSSNEDKFDNGAHSSMERKAIFLQRKQQLQQTPPPKDPSKRPSVPKSPCAFSAENESSVYAFEPDIPPPPALNHPFRRRGSRHKSSEDDAPPSSSIAVQVNLENVATAEAEQVLECSTQTEQVDNDGQLFYFPIESDNNPQEVIQGVQVKLQSTEGPEQKVIMKAKLVTKPSVNTPIQPNTRPLGDGGRPSQRPEQKVRPLSSTSTATQIKPLVGAVQPTVREVQPSSSTTFTSQGTATTNDRPELTNQSTQAAAVPQFVTPSATQTVPVPSPSLPEQSQPETKVELAKQEVSPVPDTASPVKSTPAAPAPRRSSPNEFPMPGTTPRMVDAPTFYPSEKEFQDPLEYIEQITNQAQSFGICRIVPPASFKPECKVSDDMRFTAYNQYVHKMLYRWGPNVREMTAIKKYLATQSIALKQPPWIGGMEIDLPRLYQTVQTCGGLKEVIEKKRWAKVADMMKIPKAAHDRVTKLDDIYCKFLLPYDTLSHAERSKLLEEVDADWTERERRIALEAERESKGEKEERDDNSESDEESDDGRDECITKGRTMPLSGFYRIARNTMAMWFKEPTRSAKEVENEYWRQVTSRKQHVCVNSGSIDSGTLGYGFPTAKSSSTSRHPWNLKVLTNNNGSILRSMGPLMGVTVPTLHVGMLFSACCWYRDPHGLPWIEYLHTGANKIWYGVPDLWNEELHGAMRTILPRYCQNKPIWLASDTAMVPPDLLVQQGVSLCRSVQEPGQFILVFPKAFTSTICTGYCVSESVYFAQPSWLMTAVQIFKDIKESCEPPAFALERLLFNIASDIRSSAEVLTEILPMITEVRDIELRHRKELEDLGVTEMERLAMSKGRKKSQEEPQEYECEICRGNLYLSLVTNVVEEANFCLQHAVETLTKDRSHVKNCKLMYSYDEEEMEDVLDKIKQRIETKSIKKQNVKTTGGSSKV